MKIFTGFHFKFVLLFALLFSYAGDACAEISEDEASALLQRQFIEQSDKNIDIYSQAINIGMSNDEAVENINRLENLQANSNDVVFVDGGSWSYIGTGENRILVFQPNTSFVPSVPEEKRTVHYTQRRADGIEEVIDEEHGRTAEEYNDAVNDYKQAINNSLLSGTNVGRFLLAEMVNAPPNPDSRFFHDHVSNRIDLMRNAQTFGLFNEIARVAANNNVDVHSIRDYNSILHIPPGEYEVRIRTADGNVYDANGLVSSSGSGGSGSGGGSGGGSTSGGGSNSGGSSGGGAGGSAAGNSSSGNTSLVPCGNGTVGSDGRLTDECTMCDLQILAMNILNWFVLIVVALAALLFVNAGALYMFSPTNPGNISKAHSLFMSALAGLLIVLAAWLIINVVMSALYDNTTFGVWDNMLCETSASASGGGSGGGH